MRSIHGSCHCGNITFTFGRDREEAPIGARECGCSFCQKHGGVWTSDPAGSLKIFVADRRKLTRYAFGTKTAQFWVCSTCGVVPVATSEIDGALYAVVSVRALDNAGRIDTVESKSDFSGEDTRTRLERRKKNWIPNVEVASTPA